MFDLVFVCATSITAVFHLFAHSSDLHSLLPFYIPSPVPLIFYLHLLVLSPLLLSSPSLLYPDVSNSLLTAAIGSHRYPPSSNSEHSTTEWNNVTSESPFPPSHSPPPPPLPLLLHHQIPTHSHYRSTASTRPPNSIHTSSHSGPGLRGSRSWRIFSLGFGCLTGSLMARRETRRCISLIFRTTVIHLPPRTTPPPPSTPPPPPHPATTTTLPEEQDERPTTAPSTAPAKNSTPSNLHVRMLRYREEERGVRWSGGRMRRGWRLWGGLSGNEAGAGVGPMVWVVQRESE